MRFREFNDYDYDVLLNVEGKARQAAREDLKQSHYIDQQSNHTRCRNNNDPMFIAGGKGFRAA